MRPLAIQLPDAAKLKLQTLQLARGAAEDAARSAVNRLNNLPRNGGADEMRAALAVEQGKQQHRFGQLSQLLSKVQQWLTELRPNTVLEPMREVSVDLQPGEKLSDAIESLRSKIKALHDHLVAVKAAPLPKADQQKLAVEYVFRLGQAARPTVNVVADQLRVGFRGDMAAPEDVLAFVAWAMPEAVCEALEREIDRLPVRSDAMPVSERIKRATELQEQLDQLERAEQGLIERAAADGIEVPQRPDVSPPAFLGVVTVAKAAEVAA